MLDIIPFALTIKHGGGIHEWNVQFKTFRKMLYVRFSSMHAFRLDRLISQWLNVSIIIYNPTVFFIKLSILLQYLRVFVPSRKANMGMFLAVYSVILAMLIFYLVDTAFNIFLCRPRQKLWDPLMDGGSCYDLFASMQATAIFNVVSDIAILVLPISTIWKLQIPPKKKMAIFVVFATGLL